MAVQCWNLLSKKEPCILIFLCSSPLWHSQQRCWLSGTSQQLQQLVFRGLERSKCKWCVWMQKELTQQTATRRLFLVSSVQNGHELIRIKALDRKEIVSRQEREPSFVTIRVISSITGNIWSSLCQRFESQSAPFLWVDIVCCRESWELKCF